MNKKPKNCICCGSKATIEMKVNGTYHFCRDHYLIDYYKKVISEYELKVKKGGEI